MMEYLNFIQAAINQATDMAFCLLLLGVGLVVCGFISEFFYQRKKSLQHEELVKEKRRYATRVEG